MDKLKGTLSKKGGLSGILSGASTLTGTLSKSATTYPEYTGDYEFTPSEEIQTISINAKRATADIVIQPIPNNYGLITWDGNKTTVS